VSIATRKGDQGTTGLLHGQRVAKDHPQIEAVGAFDELNVEVGAARMLAGDAPAGELLKQVQRSLVALMGEVACAEEDAAAHSKSRFARLGEESTAPVSPRGARSAASRLCRPTDGRSVRSSSSGSTGFPTSFGSSPAKPNRRGQADA
jgi:cob(I)alamin adenosyltransferase